MSRITRADVEYVAKLAHLSLAPEEAEEMTRDLEEMLEYVTDLQALGTDGIEPTAHGVPLETPLRPDEPAPAIDPELAVANAPAREGTAFRVPRVIEEH